MNREAIVFDSVMFWDMTNQKHLDISGSRQICEPSMIPLPGDRVSFDKDEEQYSVIYREFKFCNGICFVNVNLKPVTGNG